MFTADGKKHEITQFATMEECMSARDSIYFALPEPITVSFNCAPTYEPIP